MNVLIWKLTPVMVKILKFALVSLLSVIWRNSRVQGIIHCDIKPEVWMLFFLSYHVTKEYFNGIFEINHEPAIFETCGKTDRFWKLFIGGKQVCSQIFHLWHVYTYLNIAVFK